MRRDRKLLGTIAPAAKLDTLQLPERNPHALSLVISTADMKSGFTQTQIRMVYA